MNWILVPVSLLVTVTAVAEPTRVDEIDEYIDGVTIRISEWELLHRYITYTNPTIAAIGMPETSVTG